MDADLSHHPEKIPELIRQLQGSPLGGGYDVVFGSRHVRGGRIENWPLTRKVISKGASILARPVTSLRNPMSGFFFLKRRVIMGRGEIVSYLLHILSLYRHKLLKRR